MWVGPVVRRNGTAVGLLLYIRLAALDGVEIASEQKSQQVGCCCSAISQAHKVDCLVGLHQITQTGDWIRKFKKIKPTKGNSSSQGIPRYPRQTKSNPRPKGQKRITTKKEEEEDEGPTGIIHIAVCRDRPPRANKASPPYTHTHTALSGL